MSQYTKIVSLIALVVTTLPSILYFLDVVGPGLVKPVTLLGTIVWFIATPLWMGRTTSQ